MKTATPLTAEMLKRVNDACLHAQKLRTLAALRLECARIQRAKWAALKP